MVELPNILIRKASREDLPALVAMFAADVLGGTFQTMVTTSLTGGGSSAMIIEAVQTRADMRGQGVGAAMIEFAIAEAKRPRYQAGSPNLECGA